MSTFQDLVAEVQEMRTVVEGVKAFVNGVKAELAALKNAGSTVSASDIQGLIDALDESQNELAEAISTQPEGTAAEIDAPPAPDSPPA